MELVQRREAKSRKESWSRKFGKRERDAAARDQIVNRFFLKHRNGCR